MTFGLVIYDMDIEIDLPRQRVIELFDNSDNMVKWQDELTGYTHKSGTPGESGEQMVLHYKMGKREFDMIETITDNNLPESMSGTYDVPGGRSASTVRFEEIDDGKRTRWHWDMEMQCDTLMMKIMAFLMPGAFRKQTAKHMQAFKTFAENAG